MRALGSPLGSVESARPSQPIGQLLWCLSTVLGRRDTPDRRGRTPDRTPAAIGGTARISHSSLPNTSPLLVDRDPVFDPAEGGPFQHTLRDEFVDPSVRRPAVMAFPKRSPSRFR